MRVTLLNEFFFPDVMGGTPKVLSESARALTDDHGFQITAVTSRNSYRDPSARFEPEGDWDGVRILRVDAPHWTAKGTAQRLLGNLVLTRRVARRMRSVPADVVFVSTAPVTLPMAAFPGRKKTPYAYVVYDLDPDRTVALGLSGPDSRPVRMLRRSQRKWLHGAAKVIAIGRCMKRHLVREYGVPEDRVDVVEVGADPDTVRPAPRESSEFRRTHGLTGFQLVYTGNFGKYHDFDAVLDAAALLRGEEIGIVLVGRGAKKAHLESRIAAEGLTNVRMFDFVPEEAYGDLLAGADACLVTLEAGMEGLCVPSKFYSILAAGRPTVATMNPESEVAYVMAESECGLRVPLEDPAALAEALRAMARDPDRTRRMGENARRVFDEKYSAPVVARKLAATLRAAAAG